MAVIAHFAVHPDCAQGYKNGQGGWVMGGRAWHGLRGILFGAIAVGIPVIAQPARTRLDLSRSFGLTAGWQLLVTQGSNVEDPGGNQAPGKLHLCITHDGGKTCLPSLDDMLASPGDRSPFDEAHYLDAVRIVRPTPDHPLLWVQVASMHGANGDQRVGRMALAYDRAAGRFTPVYRQQTGLNNNQDVRYIDKGPLKGAIISAEPTSDAPFAFWIVVNRMKGVAPYRPVLRYRSGTRYGDGNPLGVIDSEMPEIQRRLNLWRPGSPLPLPDRPCAKPRLIERVLWCSGSMPNAG